MGKSEKDFFKGVKMPFQMSQQELKGKVNSSLELLLFRDSFLLENDGSERSITHKFAEYLQQHFANYHVDCEYNKKGLSIKALPRKCFKRFELESYEYVYPDIIIHHRGSQLRNLLVVEVKQDSSPIGWDCDEAKLKKFTEQSGSYAYTYGLFVNFKKLDTPELVWFQNGVQI